MHSTDVDSTIQRVRARVTAKTLIQDVSEPLTGQLDRRRLAAKFTNLESAVSDLADAVATLDEKIDAQRDGIAARSELAT
jgi:outer membrane murein-binding lipoprotein Lpp